MSHILLETEREKHQRDAQFTQDNQEIRLHVHQIEVHKHATGEQIKNQRRQPRRARQNPRNINGRPIQQDITEVLVYFYAAGPAQTAGGGGGKDLVEEVVY